MQTVLIDLFWLFLLATFKFACIKLPFLGLVYFVAITWACLELRLTWPEEVQGSKSLLSVLN